MKVHVYMSEGAGILTLQRYSRIGTPSKPSFAGAPSRHSSTVSLNRHHLPHTTTILHTHTSATNKHAIQKTPPGNCN